MSDSNDTLIIKEATVTPKTAYVDEVKSSNTPDGDTPLNLEFNRANIEALGNHINLVDSDEDSKVDMFCYVKCGEDDNELLKQCRGVVFSGNDLVMKAFPYTSEFNHTEIDEINTSIGDIKDWSFYEAHEGACVRMFNHSGKWFVSTHRKLDAFRSKWASRESFGASFKTALMAEEDNNPEFKAGLPDGENILERFQSTLDTSKQYMFLVRNTKDNRIVCGVPDRATVYHVGTFVDGALVMTEDVKITVPTKLKFTNTDELQEYVVNVSYRELQGVIGFNENNKQVKIINKDYQDLFHARGNEPSIKFRYLQVRMNSALVNMLYHLYPDMTETFDEYENTLFEIGRGIYRAYVNRFIKKRYVTVPREEFAVIRECHTWHLVDRTENRISLDQVVIIMNQQSATNLNHMIRRFKLEMTRQKEQTDLTLLQSQSARSNKSFEQSPAVRKINSTPIPYILPGKKNDRNRTVVILPRKPLYVPKTDTTANDK
jgi:hypothetical protein